MARLKKVSDDEFQLVCDCGKFVHSLTLKDGKPHVETLRTNTDDDRRGFGRGTGEGKRKAGVFDDWFGKSGDGDDNRDDE